MKVLVIGLGSMGRRHARYMENLGHEVFGCDPRPAGVLNADLAPEEWAKAILVSHDLEDVFMKRHVDAALVCSPPQYHCDHVMECIANEVQLIFVEKPMAMTVKDAETMEYNCPDLTVGYQLFAHAGVRKCPRYWKRLDIWDCQDWATWPPASYERNFLAEFSHELALAVHLAGPAGITNVKVSAHGSDLLEAVLDVYHNGPIYLHLRGNRQGYDRGLRADLHNGSCYEWTFNHEENVVAYRKELEAFLAGQPLCSAQEGVEVVRLMEALK